jgi:hypothetical protein
VWQIRFRDGVGVLGRVGEVVGDRWRIRLGVRRRRLVIDREESSEGEQTAR